MTEIKTAFCMLMMAVSPLAAAQQSWFHAGLVVGTVNREVEGNNSEFWVELDVTNVDKSTVTVSWEAYRFDGTQIRTETYKLAAGEKRVLKVDDPETELLSANPTAEALHERLDCMVLLRPSGQVTATVRQNILHGDKLNTTELGAMVTTDSGPKLVGVDLLRYNRITVTNLNSKAKSALICRGELVMGCITKSTLIRVPAFGTVRVPPPDGLGTRLIVNGGPGLAPVFYREETGSTSTFEVNSGVTFGKTLPDSK
jgi:hypothetical protein